MKTKLNITNQIQNKSDGILYSEDPFHLDKLIVKHKHYESGYFFSTPIVKDIISYYIVPYKKHDKQLYDFERISRHVNIFLFKKGKIDKLVDIEVNLMDKVLNELKESLGRIKKSD